MKEGFIRIVGTPDIFYDSINRLYRYRMHCPTCGGYSGCLCFKSLEEVIDAWEEGNNCTDLYICVLLNIVESEGWDEILYTMNNGMGWKWKIKAFMLKVGLYFNKYWISEDDCKEYLDEVGIEYNEIAGEFC